VLTATSRFGDNAAARGSWRVNASCGCGNKIPFYAFGTRTYDHGGPGRLLRGLKIIEELDGRDVDDEPAIREWYEQGDALIPVPPPKLVHGPSVLRSRWTRAAIREWQATGREIETLVYPDGAARARDARKAA